MSVIVPIYNEDAVIEVLHSRLLQVLARVEGGFEVIWVNDGSRDNSERILDAICAADSRFKVLHFSRNFGHQSAVTAGLRASSGQCAAVIDADLQDPPEVILDLLQEWRNGSEVIHARRISRAGESVFKRASAFVFYRTLRKLTDVDVPPDAGDFCLLDRKAVDVLNAMPERHRYLRGLRTWVGFRQATVDYERQERHAGTTKYPFKRMIALAIDGILSLSKVPLRISTYIGLFVSAGSLLLGLVYIVLRVAGAVETVRGWASLMVVILFLGGVQLICIGVIGEFVGRVYDEVKQRPLYVISRSTGF